jgi:CelD/BcsL family acetyltransferase involved in cellulose biosynthesis
MARTAQAAFDAQDDVDLRSMPDRARASTAAKSDIRLSVHGDLSELESEWRAFEQIADCTVFQTFDWMSAWHRNIGVRAGVTPAIVVGRDAAGELLFIMPLGVTAGGMARRLVWFASDLCDYNAPLLTPDFARRIDARRFVELWRDIVGRLRSHPDLRYDLIHFEKMPEKVGAQPNPMLAFPVVLNPSHAYLTHLNGDWETFYAAKRSSATRRRDRTKRKRLGEFGQVKFVNPAGAGELASSFDVLMQQKTLQFARMGVPNIFARPGYPDFYREVAGSGRGLAHISRLDVGDVPAAVNFGLTFRGCYYHVLASYTDQEMSKFGPGAAHLHDLMAYALSRGCDTFDFTIGDERYKRDWCDTELKLFDRVVVTTARGLVVAGPLLGARAVKRRIKQTPVLWDAVSRMRAAVAAMRRRSEG